MSNENISYPLANRGVLNLQTFPKDINTFKIRFKIIMNAIRKIETLFKNLYNSHYRQQK